MEKRLILAIALSIFIIMSFQIMAPKGPHSPSVTVVTKEAPPTVLPKDTIISAPSAAEVAIQEKELKVDTDRYILTFSNMGGAIKNIWLKEYKDIHTGGPLWLADIRNPKEYIFTISSADIPGIDIAAYSLTRSDNTITYFLSTKDFEISKRYTLHNSKYGIELEVSIRNISDSPRSFNYNIIGGAGINETKHEDKRFLEVTSVVDGKYIGFKRPKDKRITNLGIVAWTALKSKYFSLILKPLFTTRGQFYKEDNTGLLTMGVDVGETVIQPKSVLINKYLLYAGPSHIPALKEFGYGLESTVSYGFFGGISKVMISVMRFFHSIVQSWGLSIILLSVFLNFILFPLTMKSFRSMQKMQELHPEMERLKKQYKDNPQKLNKEIMDLYRKYNINPFSGCLPILLQMPIFIALYSALMRSIELRNASFLWIRDLSAPDAVKLPFALPIIGNNINILPLVMVLAMALQQKISTKSMGGAVTVEQKEQQRLMMIMMPIVFGFVFYNMPSGLVLYWLVNTALTIFEQGVILKKSTT
ncbi:MAG: membrane protein insertase YidC [Candidatus Omnitrophica bacterium]|nr:membrane protein insertase YidC [Candidatus Omnitrophota bacterium]MCM8791399.1 membrane protein insertase YidC [Candidatus Omnitrophota bacterium]